MLHIQQPFFSIVTAGIFTLLGVFYGVTAGSGEGVIFSNVQITVSASWALSGLMFLMAYFALVHLKD